MKSNHSTWAAAAICLALLIGTVSMGQEETRQVATDDAILILSFEPTTLATATTFQDASKSQHLAVLNGTSSTEGRIGTALRFDGRDDYLQLDLRDDLVKDTSELTIAMWLYAQDSGQLNMLFDVRETTGKRPSVVRMFFTDAGATADFAFGTPAGEVRVPVTIEKEWHHIAGVWKDDTVWLFVDGRLAGEHKGKRAVITPAVLGVSSTRIGAQANRLKGPKGESRCFRGAIDEFLVLRRALSVDQIGALVKHGMNQGQNKPLPTTIDDEIAAALSDLNPAERRFVERVSNGKSIPIMKFGPRRFSDARSGEWGILRIFVSSGVKVRQVIDGDEMLISPQGSGEQDIGWAWLEGVSTAGISDDARFSLDRRVLVLMGTKSYTNSLGARKTVKRFVLANTSRAKAALKTIRRLKSFRIWKDAVGETIGLGRFDGYENTTVRIEMRSRETQAIPLRELSNADQQWVRDELKRRRAK